MAVEVGVQAELSKPATKACEPLATIHAFTDALRPAKRLIVKAVFNRVPHEDEGLGALSLYQQFAPFGGRSRRAAGKFIQIEAPRSALCARR